MQLVRDIHTGKAFALKREPETMRHPQLEKESKYYAELEGGGNINMQFIIQRVINMGWYSGHS